MNAHLSDAAVHRHGEHAAVEDRRRRPWFGATALRFDDFGERRRLCPLPSRVTPAFHALTTYHVSDAAHDVLDSPPWRRCAAVRRERSKSSKRFGVEEVVAGKEREDDPRGPVGRNELLQDQQFLLRPESRPFRSSAPARRAAVPAAPATTPLRPSSSRR